MGRTERLYRIERLLRERKCVTLQHFLKTLEVSRATFKRDLEYLRDRMGSPILWDASLHAYRLEGDTQSELPGVWFSARELHALLAAQQLLTDIDPGLLAAQLAPLRERITRILRDIGQAPEQVSRRVRLIPLARRQLQPENFADVAAALLSRKQLQVRHWNRATDAETERRLSPQRLVHYRDNWYLDAWCHLRNDLRTFALETLRSTQLCDTTAHDVDEPLLEAHFTTAYGIFAGPPAGVASLLFSAQRARWVRSEMWHPEQRGEDLPDGRYRLAVPYSDPRELLMDILRHGAHVTVEAPASLRQQVCDEIGRMRTAYVSLPAGSLPEPPSPANSCH